MASEIWCTWAGVCLDKAGYSEFLISVSSHERSLVTATDITCLPTRHFICAARFPRGPPEYGKSASMVIPVQGRLSSALIAPPGTIARSASQSGLMEAEWEEAQEVTAGNLPASSPGSPMEMNRFYHSRDLLR
jgi:hypothetical protein